MYIGVDIGGTNIKGVLADPEGMMHAYRKIPTGKSAEAIEDDIAALMADLAAAKGLRLADIRAAGIGSAGAIDRDAGIVITSPNIPAWHRYPIVRRMEERLGIPVALDNDANVAVLGEWWRGHGARFKNWLLVALGTGIGGGAVIEDRLYAGHNGSAMEFGHVTIDYQGERCPCGNTGCLELYASATALVRHARQEMRHRDSSLHDRLRDEPLTAHLLCQEAAQGDAFSLEMFQRLGFFLGVGISGLVNIFNPEAVIIGGGVSLAHRFFLPTAKRVVEERALPGLKESVQFLIIRDQEKTPALGAAKAAMDRYKNS